MYAGCFRQFFCHQLFVFMGQRSLTFDKGESLITIKELLDQPLIKSTLNLEFDDYYLLDNLLIVGVINSVILSEFSRWLG